jgi:hypothetical protein
LSTGDLPAARQLSFEGPIDTFDNAEDYLAAIQRLFTIVERVESRKEFVEGGDAVTIYDLVTRTPVGTAPVAEWITVKGGKIAAIRVYFDARPFSPPSGP